MKLMSTATRSARADLRAARAELASIAEESDAFWAANDRVIAAEARLPWWKRLDIDLTVA